MEPDTTPTLGWLRAALTVGVVFVVGFAGLAIVPDLIVTQLDGVARDTRAGLASAWFLLAFVTLAWAIRRLQAHHVI